MVEEPIQPLRSSKNNLSCPIDNCDNDRLVTIASDRHGDVMMCVRHALAWSTSRPCRDSAQHNSSASMRLITNWVQNLSA